jgi:hypothetical protein
MTNEEKRQADKMRRMARKRGYERPAKAIAEKKKKTNVVSSPVKRVDQWMDPETWDHLEEERAAVERAEAKIAPVEPQIPTVGRIVHYCSYGTPGGEFPKECRAAIVTAVEDEQMVDLAVLNPTGMFFNTEVPWASSQAPRGGTWHWPERV